MIDPRLYIPILIVATVASVILTLAVIVERRQRARARPHARSLETYFAYMAQPHVTHYEMFLTAQRPVTDADTGLTEDTEVDMVINVHYYTNDGHCEIDSVLDLHDNDITDTLTERDIETITKDITKRATKARIGAFASRRQRRPT